MPLTVGKTILPRSIRVSLTRVPGSSISRSTLGMSLKILMYTDSVSMYRVFRHDRAGAGSRRAAGRLVRRTSRGRINCRQRRRVRCPMMSPRAKISNRSKTSKSTSRLIPHSLALFGACRDFAVRKSIEVGPLEQGDELVEQPARSDPRAPGLCAGTSGSVSESGSK